MKTKNASKAKAISRRMLVRWEACDRGLRAFDAAFPDGKCVLTTRNVRLLYKKFVAIHGAEDDCSAWIWWLANRIWRDEVMDLNMWRAWFDDKFDKVLEIFIGKLKEVKA